MEFNALLKQANQIRTQYHALEEKHHGKAWSVEEDALAFLTDAGLVGRLVMDQQKSWPKPDSTGQLEHKLAECIWWLMVIAERTDVDLESEVKFLFNQLEEKTN
ncbi:MazG-like protein [Macrococcus armenti]|uniref:MazG-like protein n=1 Tax=Macrococcus armenti TaxID=2875764 RepID=UPI001CCDD0D3|nr:MazG-like protein [Macrococcus armenti]UBH13168.1 MazG-like protein [Macrococcus armenti]